MRESYPKYGLVVHGEICKQRNIYAMNNETSNTRKSFVETLFNVATMWKMQLPIPATQKKKSKPIRCCCSTQANTANRNYETKRERKYVIYAITRMYNTLYLIRFLFWVHDISVSIGALPMWPISLALLCFALLCLYGHGPVIVRLLYGSETKLHNYFLGGLRLTRISVGSA